jgi:hypothetical protein
MSLAVFKPLSDKEVFHMTAPSVGRIIRGVSGGIVNILAGCSMDYSD